MHWWFLLCASLNSENRTIFTFPLYKDFLSSINTHSTYKWKKCQNVYIAQYLWNQGTYIETEDKGSLRGHRSSNCSEVPHTSATYPTVLIHFQLFPRAKCSPLCLPFLRKGISRKQIQSGEGQKTVLPHCLIPQSIVSLESPYPSMYLGFFF